MIAGKDEMQGKPCYDNHQEHHDPIVRVADKFPVDRDVIHGSTSTQGLSEWAGRDHGFDQSYGGVGDRDHEHDRDPVVQIPLEIDHGLNLKSSAGAVEAAR
jgi:hypothetical protein